MHARMFDHKCIRCPASACTFLDARPLYCQTFDAVDGKQARRTGASSPLGELMDHGACVCVRERVSERWGDGGKERGNERGKEKQGGLAEYLCEAMIRHCHSLAPSCEVPNHQILPCSSPHLPSVPPPLFLHPPPLPLPAALHFHRSLPGCDAFVTTVSGGRVAARTSSEGRGLLSSPGGRLDAFIDSVLRRGDGETESPFSASKVEHRQEIGLRRKLFKLALVTLSSSQER